MLPILKWPDLRLAQPAKEANLRDLDLEDLVEDMIATMYHADGVGLAANQVGDPRSVFVYDAGDGPKVAINPRIYTYGRDVQAVEGCLSVPGAQKLVTRKQSCTLLASELGGKRIRVRVTGWPARIFQHEVAHLDGQCIATL